MKRAVIPARGGSKDIPRKNIKSFCGKPMIAWSIEVALGNDSFDQIIVSTDDTEVAREYGATVPFTQWSAELSDDHTGTIPVVLHAIEWFKSQRQSPEHATAPFARAEDILRGLEVLGDNSCDYAFSVTSYASPIQRAIRITSTGRVEMFMSEHFNTRSQDLEEVYRDVGQFYWGWCQCLAGRQSDLRNGFRSCASAVSPSSGH